MRSVPSVGTHMSPPPARRWRTAFGIMLAAAGFVATAAMLSSGLGLVEAAQWATTQQRSFHVMVQELMGLKGGVLASAGLIGASLAYGFLHAAVPGHGKFLIAGAGVASRASATRLVALSAAASLTQALTAIVLVYGGFSLLDTTAGWAMAATDRVLVPLSYVAILAIAVVLIRRGLRGLRLVWDRVDARIVAFRGGRPGHVHRHDDEGTCGCGHRHAPTLEETDALRTWRDVAALVAGIGLRPCTGAVFVLVAAWRMNLVAVGAASAVAMAVGTGAFISIVAVSAATARGATLFAAGVRHSGVAVPLLQLAAGAAVALVACAFLLAPLLPVA